MYKTNKRVSNAIGLQEQYSIFRKLLLQYKDKIVNKQILYFSGTSSSTVPFEVKRSIYSEGCIPNSFLKLLLK